MNESNLLNKKFDYLLNLSEAESNGSLSLINSLDLGCSVTSASSYKSIPLERKVASSSNLNTDLPTKPLYYEDDSLYYYHCLKPNLENSFSELFMKKITPEIAEEFVARRIKNAVEHAKASISCSDLQDLDKTNLKREVRNEFRNLHLLRKRLRNEGALLNETFEFNSTADSSIGKSNDSLRAPTVPTNILKTVDFPNNKTTGSHRNLTVSTSFSETAKNDTYTKQSDNTFTLISEHVAQTLKKSFSFSGLTADESDNLLDCEAQWDSLSSEEENDEFGLPIKRRFVSPYRKQSDVSHILTKYKKILRTSFGECFKQDENNPEDLEPAPLIDNVGTAPEPVMLPEIQDVDLHVKKSHAPVAAKGPMKALVPLKDMSKQLGIKINSPFKKKKEKTANISIKNMSGVMSEFFEEPPAASSTPSSGSRCSRRDSMNTSLTRSFSEGRTPSNKKKVSASNTSVEVSDKNNSSLNRTKTLRSASVNNANTLKNLASGVTRITAPVDLKKKRLPMPLKPSLGTSNFGLRRPSTAPSKIIMPSGTSKLNPSSGTTSTRKQPLVQDPLNPVKSVNTTRVLKTTISVPTTRRPSSVLGKENTGKRN